MMLVSAWLLGVFSTPHCMMMCGGLLMAMTSRHHGNGQAQAKPSAATLAWNVLSLNLGRICSYALLGLIAGIVGFAFVDIIPALVVPMRVLAGVMLIGTGLYIGQWWFGIRHVEGLLSGLWQRLQGRLKGISGSTWLTGLAWGCLPCGLVFTALTMAMSLGNIVDAVTFMVAFGLGTLPVLFFIAMASGQLLSWLRQLWLVRLIGGMFNRVWGMDCFGRGVVKSIGYIGLMVFEI